MVPEGGLYDGTLRGWWMPDHPVNAGRSAFIFDHGADRWDLRILPVTLDDASDLEENF